MRFWITNDEELRLVISRHTNKKLDKFDPDYSYYRAALKRGVDTILVTSIEDKYRSVDVLLQVLDPFTLKISDNNIVILDES